jgi:hypothetical protein
MGMVRKDENLMKSTLHVYYLEDNQMALEKRVGCSRVIQQ